VDGGTETAWAPRVATSVVKRFFDVAVSATMLLVLSPVLAFAAAAIRLTMGRPILYRQKRPGLNGEPFTILKFRTMSNARSADGKLLPDDQRATRVGRWLRKSSVDELPELLNVLRGEMSLVGPRPLLMSYLGRYSPQQARRHEARPGLTGLAQISGRNALSWPERLALDVDYVDHWNFWLDLRILLTTARKLSTGSDESADGTIRAQVFMGEDDAVGTGRAPQWDPEQDDIEDETIRRRSA
jgi:lipopolysaccharide/colanic/teichoic acid biosynthesis glycosyltransferase